MVFLLELFIGCTFGLLYGWMKAEKQREIEEHSRNYIMTNADVVKRSHDSTEVFLGRMTKQQFKQNMANGVYETPIEQTYRDAIGSPQKIGEEPVRLCRIK